LQKVVAASNKKAEQARSRCAKEGKAVLGTVEHDRAAYVCVSPDDPHCQAGQRLRNSPLRQVEAKTVDYDTVYSCGPTTDSNPPINTKPR
jgi:hypothetical protein